VISSYGVVLSGFVTFGKRVLLGGVGIDPVTETGVVEAVCAALERGAGGRIVTPNVDILRLAARSPEVRGFLADATLVVPDGAPLVWAARLAGTPLPERVCGSSLVWSLSYGLARAGRSIYLLGGAPGAGPVVSPVVGPVVGPVAGPPVPAQGVSGRLCSAHTYASAGSGARRAAAVLTAACPGLRVAGWSAPEYGFEASPDSLAVVVGDVVEAKPDLVFVGLGFPKQERVIDTLRPELPGAWFIGCGAAINFVAGDARRAPRWLQRCGLEWTHRLAAEPRRLAGRYLRHDAPYALRLLVSAATCRLGHRR
jgi:N-acetylglucosaminyldiphosphoundecaprenol N-acetyl-beta-D-mannosaminyltransferase